MLVPSKNSTNLWQQTTSQLCMYSRHGSSDRLKILTLLTRSGVKFPKPTTPKMDEIVATNPQFSLYRTRRFVFSRPLISHAVGPLDPKAALHRSSRRILETPPPHRPTTPVNGQKVHQEGQTKVALNHHVTQQHQLVQCVPAPFIGSINALNSLGTRLMLAEIGSGVTPDATTVWEPTL